MSSEPCAVGLRPAPRVDSFPSPSVASRLDRPSYFSVRVHSLVLLLPFEVSTPYLLCLSARHLSATRPARVSSLFATSRKVSTHCVRSPAPAKFRPQVFATSRRFAPPSRCAGLFRPAATSRVSPFRDFSRFCEGHGSSPQPFPHAVGPNALTLRLPRESSSASRLCSQHRCVV